ncbi:hypothetical protein C8R44DRAFT_733023 [Mycena epipterygia]|nr:hypothetical protein C8R44DRAFT_733023 [Mycena epipterygia]
MAFLSLLSAAGPSATTIEALSEYCASSDSPSSSFAHSDSSYSFISLTPPSSFESPKLVPELPDIIAQSSRFHEMSVQEKMLKALKFSTGSGFTRPVPTSSSCGRDRSGSVASTQAIYKGLPPSPSDCFFDDTSFVHTSTPARIGLGLLVPSTTTNELRLLSPLSFRSASPTPGVEAPNDTISSRLLLSPPAMIRTYRPQPVTSSRTEYVSSAEQPASEGSDRASQYAGLGHGLPSHMNTMATSFASGFTISSARSISHLLGIVPSSSYSYALLQGMPSLARCPKPKMPKPDSAEVYTTQTRTGTSGALGRLRVGAANLVQGALRRVSTFRVTTRSTEMLRVEFSEQAQGESRGLKRVVAAVGRFVLRR